MVYHLHDPKACERVIFSVKHGIKKGKGLDSGTSLYKAR